VREELAVNVRTRLVTSSLDDEQESDEQSQTRRFAWFGNLPNRLGGEEFY